MSTAPSFVQAPAVVVNGAPLDPGWSHTMTSLLIEQQLQVPTRLTLRFRQVSAALDRPQIPLKLGDMVSVKFPSATDPDRLTTLATDLEITEMGAEARGGNDREFVVVAHDLSHRFTHMRGVKTYLKMKSSDVVTKLAGEAGLKVNATATPVVHEYLMQADSAFGFITTLARRSGYDWWVDGMELHFAPPAASPVVVDASLDGDLMRFSVQASAKPTAEVTVKGWDGLLKKEVVGARKPPAPARTELAGTGGSISKGSEPLATTAGSPTTAREATELAEALAGRVAASSVVADGEMLGNPAVRPGVSIKVTGFDMGGTFPVTRCEHRYSASGYTTRFVAGDREPMGLADLLSHGDDSSAAGAFGGLPALIPAIVTQIGNDEFRGRVKVKFPHLSDGDESHWARVLAAGGGPERGFWFLPEVDDEVLVAFEGGDVRHPVVMGGLYGKVDDKKLVADGKVATRALRSRLGHFMELYDGDKPEERHISFGLGSGGRAGTEYKVRLGEDRFDIEVPRGKPIAIKSGTTQITFTDKGAIDIKGDDISITATKALKLEGLTVSISGQQEASLSQGGSKVAVGPAGAEVKGMPMTTVKGSPTVMIG